MDPIVLNVFDEGRVSYTIGDTLNMPYFLRTGITLLIMMTFVINHLRELRYNIKITF
jgi:hypothetical protein